MARPSEDDESTTKLMLMEVTETSFRSHTHGISLNEARHITVGDNCQHLGILHQFNQMKQGKMALNWSTY